MSKQIVKATPIHDFTVFLSFGYSPFINYENRVKAISKVFKNQKDKDLGTKIIKGKPNLIDNQTEEYKDYEKKYEEFKKFFYKPSFFHCWGEFDILTLSLIEGFGMGSRLNTSFDYLRTNKELNFPDALSQYHIGIGNLFKYDKSKNLQTTHNQIQQDIKIQEIEYPLMGFVKIKLNDFILFSSGNYLVECVVVYIDNHFKEKEEVDFIILHQASWCELSLLVFCKSFEVTNEILTKLTKLTVADLPDEFNKNHNNQLLFNDSLNEQFRTKIQNNGKIDVNKVSVITKTDTVLGFNQKMIMSNSNERKAFLAKIKPECTLHPITKWHSFEGGVRKGKNKVKTIFNRFKEIWVKSEWIRDDCLINIAFDQKFIKRVQVSEEESPDGKAFKKIYLNKNFFKEGCIKIEYADEEWIEKEWIEAECRVERFKNCKYNFLVTTGKGDFTLDFGEVSTKDFIEFQYYLSRMIHPNQTSFYPAKTYLKKSSTQLSFKPLNLQAHLTDEITQDNETDNFFYKNYQDKVKDYLIFKGEDLEDFRKNLKNLLIHHQLKDSLVRMFELYNRGIGDENLFSRFVELHPFLNDLLEKIAIFNAKMVGGDDIFKDENLDKLPLKLKDIFESQRNLNTNPFFVRERLDEFPKQLNHIVQAFNYAYQNRYNASYVTRELFDTNLLFNSGVHDMLTSLQALYRSACRILGNSKSFIFIESDYNFKITPNTLQINRSYIFMPELLASVYVQEISNQAIHRNDFYANFPNLFIFQRANSEASNNLEALIEDMPKPIVKKFFKKSIRYDDRFIDYWNLDMLEHIFAESIEFHLFYQKDADLFEFWFWMRKSAVTNSYVIKDDKYQMKRAEFRRYCLRLLVIFRAFDKERYKTIKEDKKFSYFKNPHIPDEKVAKIVSSCCDFIESIFESKLFEKWIRAIEKFVTIDLKVDSSHENEIINENVISIYEMCKDITNESTIIGFMKKFGEGDALEFDFQHENVSRQVSSFLMFRNITYIFLKSLKAETEGLGKERFVLKRIFKSKEVSLEENSEKEVLDFELSTGDSPILADPAGGLFIVNPHTRRRVFKLRNLYYKYLFDVSHKEKSGYIERLIKKKIDAIGV